MLPLDGRAVERLNAEAMGRPVLSGDATTFTYYPGQIGLPADAAPRATIALAECHNLAQRIRTANVAAQQKPARIRIELTGMTRYNGTFTASDAQTLAVRLLDGVCDALAD